MSDDEQPGRVVYAPPDLALLAWVHAAGLEAQDGRRTGWEVSWAVPAGKMLVVDHAAVQEALERSVADAPLARWLDYESELRRLEDEVRRREALLLGLVRPALPTTISTA